MLKFIFLLTSSTLFANSLHDNAERQFQPKYAHLAKAKLKDNRIRHPWPIPVLSIGHTIASYQNYNGSPYFHHGIDIRTDAGQDVLASAGGKVVNIENYVPGQAAYWEVAILDDIGFLWQYHHIDKDSIPQEIHQAFASGEPIPAGTKLGEVFYWPEVTFGERFHHIHLNVLGANKSYLNPFYFLKPLPDTTPPEILNVNSFRDPHGRIRMQAEIRDLILHDKFFVPPFAIRLKIGEELKTVWQFNNLPGGSDKSKYIHDFYVKDRTCGNYSCRRFTINLGFNQRDFPLGRKRITVQARDFAGNVSSRELRLH